MTNKELEAIRKDPYSYVIEYKTKFGQGIMKIKKSYWEKIQKKFTKAFSNATITSIKEIKD